MLLFYTKGDDYTWNQLTVQFSAEYVKKKFRRDPDGRLWQSVTLRNPDLRPNLHFLYPASNGVTYEPHPNGWSCDIERMRQYDRERRLHFPTKPNGKMRLKMYLDKSLGTRLQNLWDDIPPVNSQALERVGFPTQKPNALLKRIIEASSNKGGVVLDPFCGCGTAVIVAEQVGRQWIGIDITDVALEVIQMRLGREVGKVPYEVKAWEPRALPEAMALAKSDRKHFETWALGLVGARPDEPHRGADRGVDARFLDVHGRPVVVSVKSGRNISAQQIRDLVGVINREGAAVGAFITLFQPTKPMLREAAAAGSYESPTGLVPRLQIHTIDHLLDPNSRRIVCPPPGATLVRGPRQRRTAAADQFMLPLVTAVPGGKDRLPMQEVPTAAPPAFATKRRPLANATLRVAPGRRRRRAS